jgi:hypothetical protein
MPFDIPTTAAAPVPVPLHLPEVSPLYQIFMVRVAATAMKIMRRHNDF